jgi:hypothetical protein
VLKITFGGKPLRLGELGDAITRAAIDKVTSEMRERFSAVRLPATGEFPTVIAYGDGIETLSFKVEGSRELLALVRERFGAEELKAMGVTTVEPAGPPRAFLSFAWEDRALAEKIATALQANGVDTWYAEWEIGAGDSLRQKIDAGLGDCTHFLVLLSPASITKPWVNQEMDAGLVRKLNQQTRFIALRSGLPAADLPPLLSGMLAPSIDDFETDIRQLLNDIHGVSRKPPLGSAPASQAGPRTGYSAAATAVAEQFVMASESALFGDLQLGVDELASRTGLSEDDVRDALHELRDLFTTSCDNALAKDELFVQFDKHFHDWDPAADALRIAADLLNDETFPGATPEIAKRYGWPARRLNPAIAFLINRSLIVNSKALGIQPWLTSWVQKNEATRRFVKSRS